MHIKLKIGMVQFKCNILTCEKMEYQTFFKNKNKKTNGHAKFEIISCL